MEFKTLSRMGIAGHPGVMKREKGEGIKLGERR